MTEPQPTEAGVLAKVQRALSVNTEMLPTDICCQLNRAEAAALIAARPPVSEDAASLDDDVPLQFRLLSSAGDGIEALSASPPRQEPNAK